MTLDSLSYFLFLSLIYAAFYCSAARWRWLVLLAASYAFYATFLEPRLLVILGLVSAISYACGLLLGGTKDEPRRLRLFWAGAAACVVILAAAKYSPALSAAAGGGTRALNLPISIGVSFFTVQALSYLADVYLEMQEPERHLGYHALSLAFFPKLLQGPIERAGDLLPQLRKTYVFDYNAARSGMFLMEWGLFKKVVIADRLALYVGPVYGDVHAYTGLPLIIATYAYSLQIYFDFAGYTDMARGAARLFGVDLTENFKTPYLAASIADFWRRWHISFSRWLLDYIFRPLQMEWRDRGRAGTALALIVTFLVSGIWHGTSWGIVVWGLFHGAYLAASVYYRPHQKKLHQWLGAAESQWLKTWQVFVTFHLVTFAWIFFRAESLSDAWYVAKHIFDVHGSCVTARAMGLHDYIRDNVTMGRGGFAGCAAMLLVPLAVYKVRDAFKFYEKPLLFRWAVYHILFLTILLYHPSGHAFIYFRF